MLFLLGGGVANFFLGMDSGICYFSDQWKLFSNVSPISLLAEICDGCFLIPSEVLHLWRMQRDWATFRFLNICAQSFHSLVCIKVRSLLSALLHIRASNFTHYRKIVLVKSDSVYSYICYCSPPALPWNLYSIQTGSQEPLLCFPTSTSKLLNSPFCN